MVSTRRTVLGALDVHRVLVGERQEDPVEHVFQFALHVQRVQSQRHVLEVLGHEVGECERGHERIVAGRMHAALLAEPDDVTLGSLGAVRIAAVQLLHSQQVLGVAVLRLRVVELRVQNPVDAVRLRTVVALLAPAVVAVALAQLHVFGLLLEYLRFQIAEVVESHVDLVVRQLREAHHSVVIVVGDLQ